MPLESGTDKVNEICKIIRDETLQPAQDQALQIINEAKAEGDEIIKKANEGADEILAKLKKDLEKTQKVAEASLELAIKQGIAKLKQLVTALFTDELQQMATETLNKEDVMTKVVETLTEAIQKEGSDANVALVLSKSVDKEAFTTKLASSVREKVEKGGVTLGDFKGGVVLKMVEKKVAFEITDDALVDLISPYLSEHLRETIFHSSQ